MSKMKSKIVIFGCGGHSRSVADVILRTSPHVSLIFVDGNAQEGEKIYGFKTCQNYQLTDESFFLAIGDNLSRKNKFEELGGKSPISIISDSAHKGHQSTIESGCFVGNFCHIGPEAIISKNTIINTAAVIEHEVIIGAHNHIGPNATISGRCKTGELVFVGVGATIKDSISICSNVMIGAGATIVKDITEPGTYVGTPARRIR